MARVLEQAGQLGIQARAKQKDRMSRSAGKEKTKERAKARKARRAKENRCRREKESVWRQTFAGSVGQFVLFAARRFLKSGAFDLLSCAGVEADPW